MTDHGRKVVKAAVAFVVFLAGAFGGMATTLAPPEAPGSNAVTAYSTIVSVAALLLYLGLSAIAARIWPEIVIAIAIIMLVGSFVLGGLYIMERESLVIVYEAIGEAATPFVRGSDYTDAAESWRSQLGERATDQFLLRKFAGDPSKVWTAESIAANRLRFIAIYVSFVATVIVTVMCVAEWGFGTKPDNTGGPLTADSNTDGS